MNKTAFFLYVPVKKVLIQFCIDLKKGVLQESLWVSR
jgi:hypothetical protein